MGRPRNEERRCGKMNDVAASGGGGRGRGRPRWRRVDDIDGDTRQKGLTREDAQEKINQTRQRHVKVGANEEEKKNERGVQQTGQTGQTVDVRARDLHLYDLLALQCLHLAGPPLPVAVAVPQLPVVAVAPTEHLAALRQSEAVAVRPDRRHQLRHHEAWRHAARLGAEPGGGGGGGGGVHPHQPTTIKVTPKISIFSIQM